MAATRLPESVPSTNMIPLITNEPPYANGSTPQPIRPSEACNTASAKTNGIVEAAGTHVNNGLLPDTTIGTLRSEGNEKASPESSRKQVRVYMDGCFDLIHFGHANAIRQAKEFGDYLCVGAHSDEDIALVKRPPVYSAEERYKLLRAIKWVDEVIESAPGMPTDKTLQKFGCDLCVHGDDHVSRPDGRSWYHELQMVGKYKEYKRTVGVSTTDLIARILSRTKTLTHQEHEAADGISEKDKRQEASHDSACFSDSPFLMTSQYITQFASGKSPQPGDKIIYVCGAFDLFHVGHLDFLEKVAAEGQFVIVGLHHDHIVTQCKGAWYPIQTLNERVLNVLAFKYVSEVVIGAPYEVTAELMDHFKVDLVCHGNTPILPGKDGSDPYAEAKKRGKFKLIDSGSQMTTEKVVERVTVNRAKLEAGRPRDPEQDLQLFNEYLRAIGRQN